MRLSFLTVKCSTEVIVSFCEAELRVSFDSGQFSGTIRCISKGRPNFESNGRVLVSRLVLLCSAARRPSLSIRQPCFRLPFWKYDVFLAQTMTRYKNPSRRDLPMEVKRTVNVRAALCSILLYSANRHEIFGKITNCVCNLLHFECFRTHHPHAPASIATDNPSSIHQDLCGGVLRTIQ